MDEEKTSINTVKGIAVELDAKEAYAKYKHQEAEWQERNEQLRNISMEIAEIIVKRGVLIKELRTVLDCAESKILSATQATL